jgi:hypothetical protein
MNRYSRKDPMDTFFKFFPYIFIGMFVVAITVIVVQFAVVGYLGYQVVTDPEGSADTVGNILGRLAAPVADAIQNNQGLTEP